MPLSDDVRPRTGDSALLQSAAPASPASLIDLLRFPACLLNAAGNLLYVNAAWRGQVRRRNANDVLGPWAQCIHADDRQAALAQFHAATATGQHMELECRLYDGETAHWFRLTLQPIVDDPIITRRWLCCGADIHALKERVRELEQRASMQTDMLDVSVDCIKLIALDGTLRQMNRAGCRALSVPEDSAFGMPWLPLLPEDVRPAGEQALATARQGGFGRFAGRSFVPGEVPRHWDNMLTPIVDGSGRATAILCVSREITAEREALDALRDSEERLAIAARVGGLGIWDYDLQRDRLRCDQAWYQIMGRSPSLPVQSVAEFRPIVHPEDVERVTEVERTAAELLKAERDYSITFRIVRPNGDIRWVRSAACLTRDAAGQATRAVGFVVDITDARRGELALRDANRALEQERLSLARQTLEDPLTGIANRRYLDGALTRICLRANETRGTVSIGMVDVDHFKAYNDRYGHIRGDAALRQIAAALQSETGSCDVIARYGGDEFTFALTRLPDPAPVLDHFIAAVADLSIVHEDSPTGRLTISCGCVVAGADAALNPAHLLEAADRALYEAKTAGRNTRVIRIVRGNGLGAVARDV